MQHFCKKTSDVPSSLRIPLLRGHGLAGGVLLCWLFAVSSWQGYAQTWQEVGNAGFTEGDLSHIAFDPVTAAPYVAYRTWMPGDFFNSIRVMRFDNTTWQPVTGGMNIWWGNIARLVCQPATGTPHVAYRTLGSLGMGDKAALVRHNTAWADVPASSPGGINPNAVDAYDFAFSPANEPYVIYKERTPTNLGPTTVQRFNGTAWVSEANTGIPFDAYNQRLAYSAADTRFITYNSQPNGTASVRRFNTASNTWELVGNANVSTGAAMFLDIAVQPGTDKPYVIYRDMVQYKTVVKTLNASNIWEEVGSASMFPGDAIYQVLAFNPTTGEPYVTFAAGGTGPKVLRFTNNTWTMVGSQAVSPSETDRIGLAFHPVTGVPYVVFEVNHVLTVKRLLSLAEINVKGNNVSIADGDETPSLADHTDFGSVCFGTSAIRTYTIENTGTEDIYITNINSSNSSFNIDGLILPTSIAPGQSKTFTVSFSSNILGTYTSAIQVFNNDENESVYDFNVQATVSPSSGIQLTNAVVPAFCTPYTGTLTQTLFTGPGITWTVTGKPAWLVVPTPATGASLPLSGTPNTGGDVTFRVQVSQNGNTSCPQFMTLNVPCPATTGISPGKANSFSAHAASCNLPFSQQFTLSGSCGGPVTWSATGAAITAGMSIDPQTGILTGNPAIAGNYSVTVTATLQTCPPVSKTYTINVIACSVLDVQSQMCGFYAADYVPSETNSFTLSGTNLQQGVTLTAVDYVPGNYYGTPSPVSGEWKLSKTGQSGTWFPTLSYTIAELSTPQTVFVRLEAYPAYPSFLLKSGSIYIQSGTTATGVPLQGSVNHCLSGYCYGNPDDQAQYCITKISYRAASPGQAAPLQALSIAPNPVTSHLSLSGGDPEATYGVRLSDVQGKTLGAYAGTLRQVETGLNQQTAALAAGVYFLHVQPEGGKAEVLRFVKAD